MNIFVLDYDLRKCAEYHVDKHVVKMIVESAQMLCSVHHMINTKDVPYKLTHKNHPCSKWARKSLSNYRWLCLLAQELCKEYSYRYEKTHKTEQVINWCMCHLPNIPDIGLTPFAQAVPEKYKNTCAIAAYRSFYINEKKHLLKWTRREVPKWITSIIL